MALCHFAAGRHRIDSLRGTRFTRRPRRVGSVHRYRAAREETGKASAVAKSKTKGGGAKADCRRKGTGSSREGRWAPMCEVNRSEAGPTDSLTLRNDLDSASLPMQDPSLCRIMAEIRGSRWIHTRGGTSTPVRTWAGAEITSQDQARGEGEESCSDFRFGLSS